MTSRNAAIEVAARALLDVLYRYDNFPASATNAMGRLEKALEREVKPDPKENPGLEFLRDREWLGAAYAEKTADQIALELGCSSSIVKYWRRRHGLRPRPGGGQPHGDEDFARGRAVFITALKAWAEENDGESPTAAEWRRLRPEGAPSDGAASTYFGSWNAALKAAGLPVRRTGVKKHHTGGARGQKDRYGRNRQMVTGEGHDDRSPGTVKHFGAVA